MSCGLRRSMRLPSLSSMNTLTKCDHGSTSLSLLRIDGSAAADDPVAGSHRHVEPDFVGVDRPLRKQVPHLQRADDRLQQIFSARLQRRHLGPQRRVSVPSISPPSRMPKMSTRITPSRNSLMGFDDLRPVPQPGDARVGRRETGDRGRSAPRHRRSAWRRNRPTAAAACDSGCSSSCAWGG